MCERKVELPAWSNKLQLCNDSFSTLRQTLMLPHLLNTQHSNTKKTRRVAEVIFFLSYHSSCGNCYYFWFVIIVVVAVAVHMWL